MPIYNNTYAEQIYNILKPLIGEAISKGALKSQCLKISITEESIRYEHLIPLAEGIRRGLVMFIGTDEAKKVAEKIARCR